ncbi:dipeptidase PepV [Acholeplasma sp. OttesenSCG-928-E16]|nr:dipeptidase PepV [Acholeplasma sp. OttesenSCG-928-E16]
MEIDFKKEVESRKDAIINDLVGLIKINSELTSFDPNRKDAPFGEGIRDSLLYMLDIAKRDGFEVLNVDGYAGHIIYGNQNDFVGSIGHLDVVPAGNNWTFPPYGAIINNNRMYGRGTEDDKGPTIAFYYAMKILKDLKVPLTKRIKLILATDEETGWRGVEYYFKKFPEKPVSGFIPDADFPLIYAEKGIANIKIKGTCRENEVKKIEAGFRSNMVPDFCEATLKVANLLVMKQEFEQFLTKSSSQGSTRIENDQIIVRINGKSAHGSTPELGINAIWLMFEFLRKVTTENELVEIISKYFSGDTKGIKLGFSHTDKEMGDLTNNLGTLFYQDGKYEMDLNIRYPKGITANIITNKLAKTLEKFDLQVELERDQPLLYVDPNSDLVQKLMSVYVKHTNDKKAKPIVIGGGTFARAMPNVVAFGPHFLDKESFIHQKDEFIDLDDFFKAIAIYAESLYELSK